MKEYLKKHFEVEKILASQSVEANKFIQKEHFKGMFFLKLFPWLCLFGFAFSFFWDFPYSKATEFFGIEYQLKGILKTVSIAGLIGYFTNWLAIKMLFHPRQKRALIPQGLIPAQKPIIVQKIAEGIYTNILNEEKILALFHNSNFSKKITEILTSGSKNLINDEEFYDDFKEKLLVFAKNQLEDEIFRKKLVSFVKEKAKEELPSGFKGFVVKSFFNPKGKEFEKNINDFLQKLPEIITGAMDDHKEDLKERLFEQIQKKEHDIEKLLTDLAVFSINKIDLLQILKSQLEAFEDQKLEAMILGATNKQLQYIQYLGAVLGALGGLIIWQPILMGIVLLVLLLILYSIDELILKFRK